MQKTQNPIHITKMTSLAMVLASLALTSCGQVGARPRDAAGHVMPTLAELDPSSSLYAAAVNKAGAGDCRPEVLDVITCFAWRGHGYEGAQTTLGQCDLKNGKTAEGVEWIKRAANAGWADAQLAMSRIYYEGNYTNKDLVQAAHWNLLYRRNPALMSLGATPDDTVSTQIASELSVDERDQALRTSSAWHPTYWSPSEKLDSKIAETCHISDRRQVYHPPVVQDTPTPY